MLEEAVCGEGPQHSVSSQRGDEHTEIANELCWSELDDGLGIVAEGDPLLEQVHLVDDSGLLEQREVLQHSLHASHDAPIFLALLVVCGDAEIGQAQGPAWVNRTQLQGCIHLRYSVLSLGHNIRHGAQSSTQRSHQYGVAEGVCDYSFHFVYAFLSRNEARFRS